MNVGLKKYLENIIGDNILRKFFFGKFESGRTGAVRTGLEYCFEIQKPETSHILSPGRNE